MCSGKGNLKEKRAIEVGNIFPLATKYSDAFGLTFKDEKGVPQKVLMGCYGIGVGRLIGAISEICSDENGLIWPSLVAPYTIHLLSLGSQDEIIGDAKDLYKRLTSSGCNVLFDDRHEQPGVKLKDADLLGIPYRVVIGSKTDSGKYELKKRSETGTKMVSGQELEKLC